MFNIYILCRREFTYLKKINIDESPSQQAARGEIVELGQLDTRAGPALIPVPVVVAGPRRSTKVSVSRAGPLFWVAPMFS